MIKVCFISPTFPGMNCGVGDYTLELVKSLNYPELDIGVITSDHEKVKQSMKVIENAGFSLFPIIKRWNFSNVSLLLEKIRKLKPDIIHMQYHWWITNDGIIKGLMAVFLPLSLKIAGIKTPFLTTLHSRMGGPYLFPKASFLRRWALLPLLLFSDQIIVTNKFDGRSLSKWLPFLKNKISYVLGGTGHYLKEDGFKKEDILRLKSQLKSKDEEIILSNFGFMIPYKGLEELLEAMSNLRKKGYPLKLLAIGGFDIEVNFAGSYFDSIRKMAGDLNLEPHIKWTGFCEAKQASLFLLASDICVMPFREGASEWRSSFLDALSHGLPIVTTYSDKTPEELVNRINVMLVPPEEPERLAGAIEELINHPEMRESIGRAAGGLYNRVYDWRIISEKTLAAYKQKARRRDR